MKTELPLFILYVHDMDRALAFYRDVFELDVLQATPGWSMLRVGTDATLGLHILDSGNRETITSHAGLNLQVEDLDKAIEAATAGGAVHKVTREADGFVPVRMCELTDPEGNGIELRQFVGPGIDQTRQGG